MQQQQEEHEASPESLACVRGHLELFSECSDRVPFKPILHWNKGLHKTLRRDKWHTENKGSVEEENRRAFGGRRSYFFHHKCCLSATRDDRTVTGSMQCTCVAAGVHRADTTSSPGDTAWPI